MHMSDLGIEIRPGLPSDAAGILECLVSTLAERIWFDRDEHEVGINGPDVLKESIREFRPGEKQYLVAVHAEQLVGFILIMRGNLKGSKHAADFGMSILPGFREKGIGSMLVQGAIEWANHHGVEKLFCSTLSNNIRAVKLYEKFNFTQEGVRRNQYKISGEYVDQVLFGLMLK